MSDQQSDTGDLLMAVAHALRRRHGSALQEWDLAPGQTRALGAVAELGPARLSALAERLRIAPRSATEVVDALEHRGLVVRGADPADRRATTVSLTPEGRGLLGVVQQARRTASAAFLADLSAADRREFDRILRLLS